MLEIKSSEFQKTMGTQFLRDLFGAKDESDKTGIVSALNGRGGEPLRQVKVTHLPSYEGKSTSCREIKGGGVVMMLKYVDEGKDVFHARLDKEIGTAYFKMEAV